MLAENDMKAEQWDTILPAAVCALNVLWRNNLGASPHQIVFGVRARVYHGQVASSLSFSRR